MKIKSKKQKGRRLQKWVAMQLHKYFPQFAPGDVRVAIMGERGQDVKLSPFAQKIVPYDFECKNQEKNRTVFRFYEQAKRIGVLEPVLVVKQNKQKPLVVIDAEHFFKLIKC